MKLEKNRLHVTNIFGVGGHIEYTGLTQAGLTYENPNNLGGAVLLALTRARNVVVELQESVFHFGERNRFR